MSTLVLHMDKFKKEAVRGIQSHNHRERESHSNPDIDYARSSKIAGFCATSSSNYLQTIQNRIDDLLMVGAVRKDAVLGLPLLNRTKFKNFLRPPKEISSDRRFYCPCRIAAKMQG